jgi:uncharacterized protein (TIGR00730 family)
MGVSPLFRDAARAVGRAIADHEITLVYGGGMVGLMGIVADAALEAGGRVIGVIPEILATREVAHEGLTELHIVSGMHERKALMTNLSNAFLTLPGGIGTYEEFFEILSWTGLKIHQKPMGILNVAGYFDPLLALLAHGRDQGFVRNHFLEPLITSEKSDEIVAALLQRMAERPSKHTANLEIT